MTKDVYCSQGEVATNILLASISTALHLGNGPVTGQVGFFGIITSQQSFHCFSVILFVHNGQVCFLEILIFIVWLLVISIHSQGPGVPFEKSLLLAFIILYINRVTRLRRLTRIPQFL